MPGPPSRFGFVVHPLGRLHLLVYRLWRLGRGAGVLKRYPRIVTRLGGEVRGVIYGVPLLPRPMLEDQAASVEAIRAAVDDLAASGVGAVGLGALCAVVGSRGRAVAEGAPIPVTTGHELTCWAAVRTVARVAARVGAGPDEPVVVLGAPWAVAVGIAELLASEGRSVLLVGKGRPLERIAARTDGLDLTSRGPAIAASRLVVSASSGGGIVQEAELRPGTVVVDVARPRDLVGPRARTDILSVDGEMMRLPYGTRLDLITRAYNVIVGQSWSAVFACFAAPMIAAIEGAPYAASEGRFLGMDAVRAWGHAADRHGFHVDDLYDRGRRLSARALHRLAETRRTQGGV